MPDNAMLLHKAESTFTLSALVVFPLAAEAVAILQSSTGQRRCSAMRFFRLGTKQRQEALRRCRTPAGEPPPPSFVLQQLLLGLLHPIPSVNTLRP